MPSDKSSSERKRMIVEEVSDTPSAPVIETPEVKEVSDTPIVNTSSENTAPVSLPINHQPVPQPQTQYVPESNSSDNTSDQSNNITWILIPGIMLLGALLGGIIFYQNKVSTTDTPTPTPVLTQAPSATPTPTPVAEDIDLKMYKVALQNGSGIKGEAAKVAELLEKAGFEIGTTGNAAKFDYTSSIIQMKEGTNEAFITKLKEVLSEDYKIGKSVTLPESSKDDVVIIIGSTKS